MTAAIERSVPVLLAVCVRASLLLGVAILAARAMRRASADARHLVVAMGLTAFVIVPAVTATRPPWTISAPAAWVEQPLTGALLGVSRPSVDWGALALWVWVTGAALVATRVFAGMVSMRGLASRSTEVTDPLWTEALRGTASRLGLRRPIRLLQGVDRGAPMTWGLTRPTVWLPPGAADWSDDLRAAVISHELAHVRRLDVLTQWLTNAIGIIHWFNPLVWVAARSLRMERERACDDIVLSLGMRPETYAGILLDMARTLAGRRFSPAPSLAMFRHSQLEERVRAVLDGRAARGAVRGTRTVGFVAVALVLIATLGGARVSAAVREVASASQAAEPESQVARVDVDQPMSPSTSVPSTPAQVTAVGETDGLGRGPDESEIALVPSMKGILPLVYYVETDANGTPTLRRQR